MSIKQTYKEQQSDIDISAYKEVMGDIKRRVEVILTLLYSKESTLIYERTQIESMMLQIRIILELIVLGSLSANKKYFKQSEKKFASHWRISKILPSIENINNNYYPVPVRG